MHRDLLAACLVASLAASAALLATRATAAVDSASMLEDPRRGSDAATPLDPIRVYYAGGDCDTPEVEVEVWSRADSVWIAHPAHARVRVPSCQVEDAGRLLNELRWRCAPASADAVPSWRRFQVFDREVMSRCAVDPLATQKARTAISVTSPAEGTPVRPAKPLVTLLGSVDVGGRAGSEYDVALIVDRALPADAFAGQVGAARAFARNLAPRLGAVRIAVLSYPDPAAPDASSGARRELSWSGDPAEIDRALEQLSAQPLAERSSIPDALDAALAAFSDGRAEARPTIVIGADGSGLDASSEPAADDPLMRAVARAGQRGATLHWVALGGLAPADPVAVRRALESAPGTFRRVAPHDYATSFLSGLELPVAEAVWVEPRRGGPPVQASLDAGGRFSVEVPVSAGANAIVIHARTSDGAIVERPFEIVFDDAYLQILDRERERIRAEQHKRLELEPDADAP